MKSFLNYFPKGPVIQVLGFLIFLMLLSHLVLFLIFTKENSSAFFEVNRGLLNRQIITLIEEVAINPPEHRRDVIALTDIPNVQVSATNYPLYHLRFNTIDLAAISQALSRLKLNSHLIELSVNFGNNAWLNISATIVESHWTLQLTLFLFELLLVSAVLFSVWTVERFHRPLKKFIRSVEKLGKSLNTSLLDEHEGPQVVREATKAINHMQKRIQALVENRTQMLAAISHDLRTPITRLKLRAQLLEQEEVKDKILHDVEEMEELVNQSLLYFKQQYQQSEKTKLELNSLVEAICTDYQEVGKAVTFRHADERYLILGNAVELRRAFSNLIDNGLKYGGEVTVILRSDLEKAEIIVEDCGPGIPETELEKVLEPFYRTEHSRSRTTGGSGLGLSVVRDIINAHQGEIVLANRRSGGLRVTVCLPVL